MIEKIYGLYPTRDENNNNRSTGKSSRDKEKIRKLLKEGKDLEKLILNYLSDCKQTKTYLKNFGTFLNSLPEDAGPVIPKKTNIEIAIDNLKARGEL
jgi:hypothetical protein